MESLQNRILKHYQFPPLVSANRHRGEKRISVMMQGGKWVALCLHGHVGFIVSWWWEVGTVEGMLLGLGTGRCCRIMGSLRFAVVQH
eukprot:35462-Rhodomonas_salina.1